MNEPIAPKANGVGIGIEEVLAVDPEAVAVDLIEIRIPIEMSWVGRYVVKQLRHHESSRLNKRTDCDH